MIKYNQLWNDERFLIEKYFNQDYSPRQISEILNRSPSTIYRELDRNKDSVGYYSAGIANLKAIQRKDHLSAHIFETMTTKEIIRAPSTLTQDQTEQIEYLRSSRNHTITVDNGKEFSDHEKITKQTQSKVYFAHQYTV